MEASAPAAATARRFDALSVGVRSASESGTVYAVADAAAARAACFVRTKPGATPLTASRTLSSSTPPARAYSLHAGYNS